MERDLTAAQTKRNWDEYYSSIGDPSSVDSFKAEFERYVGTHTWNNSVRVVCANAVFEKGSKVLDAGSGWGRILLGVVDRHSGLNVSAIDQSVDAIKLGEKLLGAGASGNVIDWTTGDLHSLPYEDCTFDSAYSVRVFQHLNSPVQAAGEIVRVLKPNGRFVIIVQNRLCPLNFRYYSRLYSPREVLGWFDDFELTKISVTTMDFYPSALRIPNEIPARMRIESTLERIPLLNSFGGKVVLTGTK